MISHDVASKTAPMAKFACIAQKAQMEGPSLEPIRLEASNNEGQPLLSPLQKAYSRLGGSSLCVQPHRFINGRIGLQFSTTLTQFGLLGDKFLDLEGKWWFTYSRWLLEIRKCPPQDLLEWIRCWTTGSSARYQERVGFFEKQEITSHK
ncbi:hypothetical protein Tco_0760447 [Tanacetum coccineum]